MPGGGGVKATREIRRLSPQTRVVALSAYDDRGTVLQMVRAGVSGYLVKGGPPEEIVETIHRSVRGYGALSGEVAAEVIAELGGHLAREELENEERRMAVERIEADRLVVEITEHAKVEDYEALAHSLRTVRSRGARLAIDDAGAGFASLRHILLLAPEVIKLDISLTRDVHSDRARRALASAL